MRITMPFDQIMSDFNEVWTNQLRKRTATHPIFQFPYKIKPEVVLNVATSLTPLNQWKYAYNYAI